MKYKYRYIDYLPVPEEDSIEHFQFGSYIHQIFEEGDKLSSEADLIKLAEEIRPRYKISEAYRGKDLICIKNFLKFNAKLGETIAKETKFEVPLKDDITYNGIIDRVIKGLEGGLLIIDYKTGKRQKTKIDLYNDTQLKGYAFAASKLYGVPLEKITVSHYYPLTDTFVSLKYSNIQILEFVNKVVKDVWTIRKKKITEFKPSKNEFCDWCPFKKACPEFNTCEQVTKRIDELKALKKDAQK